MTRNEKIAEVMGWNYKLPETIYRFASDSMGIAKLLQAKMVADDKLMICIWQISDKLFSAEAFTRTKRKGGQSLIAEVDADTEPAALHALFCKVYGITEPASIAGGITV